MDRKLASSKGDSWELPEGTSFPMVEFPAGEILPGEANFLSKQLER